MLRIGSAETPSNPHITATGKYAANSAKSNLPRGAHSSSNSDITLRISGRV